MANVAVDFYVNERLGAHAPIEGLEIMAYTSSGLLAGTTSSDAEGYAGLALPEGATYELRFFRINHKVTQPQMLQVGSEPLVVHIAADPVALPISSDPRLCLLSGYFRNWTGGWAKGATITLRYNGAPQLVDGIGVLQDRYDVIVDERGYAQVLLLRGVCLQVEVQPFQGPARVIRVPDAPSGNLPDVLFPVVSAVVVSVGGVLAVGERRILVPEVWTSANVQLEGAAQEDVHWEVDDSSIVSLELTPTSLVLQGRRAGSTTLRATRKDTSVTRVPDPAIEGVPLTVTVV